MRIVLPAAVLLSTALCLTACSSLERSSDLEQHRLTAHQSSKTDVVNAIGLPRSTEKRENEVEVWYYTGKPISTSYFVPMPTSSTQYSPGINTVSYADLGAKQVIGKQPVVLICIFDRAGQLVQLIKPEEKQ